MSSPLPPCQLICEGCSTRLVYPEGSTRVRCVLCSWVTDVTRHWAQIQCGRCRVTLMYPATAHAVRCPYCHCITCLTLPSEEEGTQIHTVIVENPKTLDESGRLVSSMAVGISRRRP